MTETQMPTAGEFVEMMRRCREEIKSLRAEVERLRPKAEAYESLQSVLRLLPQPNLTCGEDLVWRLNKRIDELTKPATAI